MIKTRTFQILIFNIFWIIACSSNSTSQTEVIAKSIIPHPNHIGMFLIEYDPIFMLDKFGPGYYEITSKLKKSNNSKEINEIWHISLSNAVISFIKNYDLVPQQCANGIDIISSSFSEGMSSAATVFRCINQDTHL